MLFELLPALKGRVPRLSLAELPTPVEDGGALLRPTAAVGELWLKRDDLSSPVYGGNKVRLLEHVLGAARAAEATDVCATGAVGSNFALATSLHARRAGLSPWALCFPQPLTADSEANQRQLAAQARVVSISHWSMLPLASERLKRNLGRDGRRLVVLSQVSFAAEALFGYLAAGLELAYQVQQRLCPMPARVVLPIGSSATTAGIWAGLSLGRKLGLWAGPAPRLAAVRIAAWPLSRRARVRSLAQQVLAAAASLGRNESWALRSEELIPLELVTDELGAGYPFPTSAGRAARELFESAGYRILDDTYSAKAAAHALSVLRRGTAGPVLFWCTKSSAQPAQGLASVHER